MSSENICTNILRYTDSVFCCKALLKNSRATYCDYVIDLTYTEH